MIRAFIFLFGYLPTHAKNLISPAPGENLPGQLICACEVNDEQLELHIVEKIRPAEMSTKETPMKARIGFVLFICVFIVMAVVMPLLERVTRVLQQTIQASSIMGERFVRGTRFVAKKINMAEWKNFTQKAS